MGVYERYDPQDREVSYIHGMIDGIIDRDFALSFAIQKSEDFIAFNESAAIEVQANWILSGHRGYSPLALTYFGNALHTRMDRFSPSHRNYKPWYGIIGSLGIGALFHLSQEVYIFDSTKQAATNEAQNAFINFIQGVQSLTGSELLWAAGINPFDITERKYKEVVTVTVSVAKERK
jgi:hypothetical protein